MGVKRIKSGQARGLFGQIMDEVYYKGNDFIVERGKKAMAVIISIDEYEKIQKERDLYKSIIDTAEVLNDTELMNGLKQSIKEIEKGETVPYEEVEKELDEKVQDVHSFYIKEFLWDNKRFILKKDVVCHTEFKDDLWIYKVPDYGLHTFSENKEEAFNDLHEEFAFLCEDLLDESDEKLTCRAIKLRDTIKFNLEKIL